MGADHPPRVRSLITELLLCLRVSSEDLIEGKKFWIPVILALLPVIVGALTISSRGSRLVVTLEADQPQYEGLINPRPSPKDFPNLLKTAVHDELNAKVSTFFAGAQPPVPDPGTEKKMAGYGVESANRGGVLGLYLADAKVTARVKVTNIGSRPSSVDEIVWYVIEKVDGRRTTVELQTEASVGIKLPEGEPVQIDRSEGKVVVFPIAGVFFVEYEIVRIVDDLARKRFPKERNLFPVAEPYLLLLHSSSPVHQKRALRIADPSHQSQIILGIEVRDVFGRTAAAETVLMDSENWNHGTGTGGLSQ